MDFVFSLDNIELVVANFFETNPNKVVLFNGLMGAGKTTFIKALCKHLGVEDVTSSPTFSLVNDYETSEGTSIYHFDLYRINSEIEALDMGIEEYLYSNNWCFIEWPEKIPNLLPEKFTTVNIREIETGERALVIIFDNLER